MKSIIRKLTLTAAALATFAAFSTATVAAEKVVLGVAIPAATHGFTGGIVEKTGGLVMFNLYTNPQEDDSVGIRHIPVGNIINSEFGRYRSVLKKYPPNFLLPGY